VVRAAQGDCVDGEDAFGLIVSFDESLCHAKLFERQGAEKNICLIQYKM
jgi:hypothetical protein